jgi:hypothetical protein
VADPKVMLSLSKHRLVVIPLTPLSTTNGSGAFHLVGAGVHPFLVEALDADGNLIIGSGAPTFTIGAPSGTLGATSTQPATTKSTPPMRTSIPSRDLWPSARTASTHPILARTASTSSTSA